MPELILKIQDNATAAAAICAVSLFAVLLYIFRNRIFKTKENPSENSVETSKAVEALSNSEDKLQGENFAVLAAIAAAAISSLAAVPISKFRISSIKRSNKR